MSDEPTGVRLTMTATMAALTSSSRRGSGRHPWLCAQSMPASPRQARTSPVYSIAIAAPLSWASDGRNDDSGSLTFTVSKFGAVAPTSMPSSRPRPDRVTATRGSDSLLQASLRITALMMRSIGPLGLCRSTRPSVLDLPTAPTDPGGSAESVDTCVTWAIPPSADLRGHGRRGYRHVGRPEGSRTLQDLSAALSAHLAARIRQT